MSGYQSGSRESPFFLRSLRVRGLNFLSSWVQETVMAWHKTRPKMVATAASAASRPEPMRTTPLRGTSLVASKSTQRLPM